MTNNPLRSMANNQLLQPTLNQQAQSATVATRNSVGTTVAVRQVSGDARGRLAIAQPGNSFHGASTLAS